MLEPGIYRDIPWDQYRSIPFISPSTLKHGLRSLIHLKRGIDGELQPSEKTTAIGQAVHCLVANESDRLAIMPAYETFDDNVTETGKKSTSKSTTFYKESKAKWESENEGKTKLTEVELAVAKKVVGNIYDNPEAAPLLRRSLKELTVIAKIEGVMCKTRIDGAVLADGHVWDIKTSPDIEPRWFYSHAKKLGYFFQFAFHQLACSNAGKHAFQLQDYDIVAAEVSGDYDTGVIRVPNQLLDDWSDKVLRVLEDFRLAKQNDYWPGLYPTGEGQLEVPEYDMSENGVFQG